MTSQSQETGANEERWEPIPDFEGYDISDQGRVRSYHKCNGAGRWGIVSEPQRILKPTNARYRSVNLRRDGETHHLRVPLLVMLAFVGPRPEGLETCHRNNDPHDDRLENLRYDTTEGNHLDRIDPEVLVRVCEEYAGGLTAREAGERCGVSAHKAARWARGDSYGWVDRPVTRRGYVRPPRKVSDRQVRDIVERYGAGGVFQRELAAEYGISESMVSRLVRGERRAECLTTDNGHCQEMSTSDCQDT